MILLPTDVEYRVQTPNKYSPTLLDRNIHLPIIQMVECGTVDSRI